MNAETLNKYFDHLIDNANSLYKIQSQKEKAILEINTARQQTLIREILEEPKPNQLKKIYARIYVMYKYGIHWKHPLYPLRLIRNFGLQFIYNLFGIKKYIFRGIEFALTFRCNFNCTHCLCSRIVETDKRKELEPDEYRRIVKEAMQMGATTFGMEGGEPFVKKNWEEIVKAWYPQYNHIIVSTNGYMLDEKLIKKCAAIGIDTFNISLDSGIEELHDVFRNKTGSFKKVMTAIKISEKYGVKIVLNTVVHKGNLYTEGLRKILAFGEKEKIMVNILFGKGVGAFKDKDVMMTKVEFEDFQKIAKGYNYWSIHHDGVLQANHGGQGCPGVREMFNLTPYGDVMNCANNHIYMGNVRENSLEEIRDYALKESPFGVRRPCFLTMDQDFMNIYYPLLEAKGSVSLKEFRQALRDYEKKHNKKVYSELS